MHLPCNWAGSSIRNDEEIFANGRGNGKTIPVLNLVSRNDDACGSI